MWTFAIAGKKQVTHFVRDDNLELRRDGSIVRVAAQPACGRQAMLRPYNLRSARADCPVWRGRYEARRRISPDAVCTSTRPPLPAPTRARNECLPCSSTATGMSVLISPELASAAR